MAKRQTRKSISVKGITYQRLKNYCDSQGRSISGVLEEFIAAHLDAEKVPVPKAIAPPPEPAPTFREDITPAIVTW